MLRERQEGVCLGVILDHRYAVSRKAAGCHRDVRRPPLGGDRVAGQSIEQLQQYLAPRRSQVQRAAGSHEHSSGALGI